ncbi:MAG: 4-(cytidine 5'-diphospho)-2-C-methyl-D-erythritol kinase [Sutterella wadsworthensis]
MTTTAARSCLNLPAPAKLNLFLHVIGQRSDGKHLLESIFILINLFDTIDLIERFDGQLERTGDIIGAPEKDLCIRAAKALLTAAVDHGKRCCGQLPGATIHVQKRIPAGAGMGGGSSDAATTLIGLNRLWKLDSTVMSLPQSVSSSALTFLFHQAPMPSLRHWRTDHPY